MKTIHCHECGQTFAQPRHDACFCKTECRKSFHNRAAVRGAQLYHLFRVMRRERNVAKTMGIWKEMCRVEFMWNEEDKKRPAHSRRWNSAAKALDDLNGRVLFAGESMGYDMTGRRAGKRS